MELGDGEPPPGLGAILTDEEMRRQERANIAAALEACNGKISGDGGAAQLLAMRPTTLASRIKALGLRG